MKPFRGLVFFSLPKTIASRAFFLYEIKPLRYAK